MFRSSLALAPLLLALLAAPTLAEESVPGKEIVVPLWQNVTKGATAEPTQEAKPETKAGADAEDETDAKAEAKSDANAEAKSDANAEAKSDANAEAKSDANAEAKSDATTDGKEDGTAQAAGAKASEESAKVGTEVDFGTLEQYRACMDSEDHIKDLRAMLEEHIAQNNEMMMEIKKQADALLEMQRKLVMSDDAQLRAFNERTEGHNKSVEEANQASEKVRAELEAFNQKSIEHNQNCASLIVRMSDRDAVIKERTPAANQ